MSKKFHRQFESGCKSERARLREQARREFRQFERELEAHVGDVKALEAETEWEAVKLLARK